MSGNASSVTRDFIRQAVRDDLASGRFSRVLTRYAPEPNAYIHLGHAISMSVTYGAAEEYGGLYNLRFDDTNPATEKSEYVRAIKEDIRWLGWDWGEREFFASDYFEQLFEWAMVLIRAGKAYVCDLSEEEMKAYRGTNAFDADGTRRTPPGTDSPFRGRGVEENLGLFERMRRGEFPDGSRTLRARIDMAHDNLIMRDPVMYRILHAEHHRTGKTWCIYPTYDWAHGQSDSMEGITHSICGMEFRHHRPLYDWFIDQLGIHHPRQVEYPRINVGYTVLGKRHLIRLVENGVAAGWDDPRLPTLRGMKRRGYPPEAIREFCARIPLAEGRMQSTMDLAFLEHCVREYLNRTAPRAMAVLDPVRLILDDYPTGGGELLEAVNNPEEPAAGRRLVPFSRELFIEREDFQEEPQAGFHRLAPGREVRLRYAYLVRCSGVEKDAQGRITAVHAVHDPATRGGDAPDGRKVKSTLHWVSAAHAVPAEVRLYERLFTRERPLELEEGVDLLDVVNPDSLKVLTGCRVEPMLASQEPGARFQFERQGYFCLDTESRPGRLVFNRTITLKDGWKRIQGRESMEPTDRA
jgi:glutaminyl-tRNA synthetase